MNSWASGLIAPRVVSTDWFRHVYRERNKAADELCNRAMDNGTSATWINTECRSQLVKICAHFDGGKRGDTAAACGWHLQGSPGFDDHGDVIWITLAWGSILLAPDVTTVDAELQGLYEASKATVSWATKGTVEFEDFKVRCAQ